MNQLLRIFENRKSAPVNRVYYDSDFNDKPIKSKIGTELCDSLNQLCNTLFLDNDKCEGIDLNNLIEKCRKQLAYYYRKCMKRTKERDWLILEYNSINSILWNNILVIKLFPLKLLNFFVRNHTRLFFRVEDAFD